jgi:hypothetical protein
VEIKPLNNGTAAPISASVDELRATVENLSLSPIGALSVIKEVFSLTLVIFAFPTFNYKFISHTCAFYCYIRSLTKFINLVCIDFEKLLHLLLLRC